MNSYLWERLRKNYFIGALILNSTLVFGAYASTSMLLNSNIHKDVTIDVNREVIKAPLQSVGGSSPVATDDSVLLLQEESRSIAVLTNDTDPNSHPLTITSVTQPTNGSVTIIADGNYVNYQASSTFTGIETFTYTINNGAGGENTATVSVEVVPDPSNGLLYDLRFDTNSNIAKDYSLANRQSTVTGPISSSTDGSRIFAQFDNTENHISLGNTLISKQPNASISLWLNVSNMTSGGRRNIFNRPTPSGLSNSPSIQLETDNSLVFAFHDASWKLLYSQQPVTANTWHHLVVTWGSNGMKMYLDGILQSSNTYTGIGEPSSYTDAIGDLATSSGYNYDGKIDNFRAYSRQLSAAEIVALRDNSSPAGTLTIQGNPNAGETLTINNLITDADGVGALIYLWYKDELLHSVGPTYTVAEADTGSEIYVVANYIDNQGTYENASSSKVTIYEFTGTNNPPSAANDDVIITHGQDGTLNVLQNDSDPDDNSLTITNVTQPSNGTASIVSSGSALIYTPNAAFIGLDSLTYTIDDGFGGTNTATVNVNVIQDPQNGLLYDIRFDDGADAAKDYSISNRVSSVSGTIPINSTGNRSFAQFDSSESYIDLGNQLISTQPNASVSMWVNISNINASETRVIYTRPRSTGSTSTSLQIATNNYISVSHYDGAWQAIYSQSPLSANTWHHIVFSWGSQGMKLYKDGVLQGTNPFTGIALPSSFNDTIGDWATWTDFDYDGKLDEFKAYSRQLSDAEVASLYSNNVPSGAITIQGNAWIGQTLSISNTLTDSNGMGAVTYFWYKDDAVHAIASNYIVTSQDVGSKMFVVARYTDGNGTYEQVSSPKVLISATEPNDAPVANNDSINIDLIDNPTILNVLINDSDADGDPLSITKVEPQQATTPLGTVQINGGESVTYTPASNYSGTYPYTDQFVYTVEDGKGGATDAELHLIVMPNSYALSDNYIVPANTATPLTVLDNDINPPGVDLLIESVNFSANASVVVYASNKAIRYFPINGFCGPDQLSYTVWDGTNIIETATVNVTVSCSASNVKPTAWDDVIYISERQEAFINVLANDTDPENKPLSVLTTNVQSGTTVQGSLVINANDTVTYKPSATYTSNTPYLDEFTYVIQDDGGLDSWAYIRVNVVPDNGVPSANNDVYTVVSGNSTVLTPLENDVSTSGESWSIDSVTATNNAEVVIYLDPRTRLRYTSAAGFCGQDQFSYTVSDGTGLTKTANITVYVDCNSTNTKPVANDDAITTEESSNLIINVLANDTDLDAQPLKVISTNVQSGTAVHGSLTVNPDHTVTYNASETFNSPVSYVDEFTYTISDPYGETSWAYIRVTVTSVNDPPTANDDSLTTSENSPVVINVLANDTDPESQSLNILSTSVQPGTTVRGSLTVNPDGTITYNASETFDSTAPYIDEFTYTISDANNETNWAYIRVTVNPVNDPPIANNDTYTTSPNSPVTIDILTNDADPESDTLNQIEVTQPVNGTVTINPDTTVTYQPNQDYCGVDTFTYTVSDGQLRSTAATVTITIDCNSAAIGIEWQDGVSSIMVTESATLIWNLSGAASCTSDFTSSTALQGSESKQFLQPGNHQFNFTCGSASYQSPSLEVRKLNAPENLNVTHQ